MLASTPARAVIQVSPVLEGLQEGGKGIELLSTNRGDFFKRGLKSHHVFMFNFYVSGMHQHFNKGNDGKFPGMLLSLAPGILKGKQK